MASQLRRAAFSVAVNIVEGFERASSSLAEAGYCLHAAKRLGYLNQKEYEVLELEVRQVAAPLRGLMKSVGNKAPFSRVGRARSPQAT